MRQEEEVMIPLVLTLVNQSATPFTVVNQVQLRDHWTDEKVSMLLNILLENIYLLVYKFLYSYRDT